MKKLFALSLFIAIQSFASADLYFMTRPKFGTNINHRFQIQSPSNLSSANSQMNYRGTLNWMEPLFSSRPDTIKSSDTYLHSISHFEISPFYTQFATGIGIQPIPFFEFSIHYSHLSFLGSTAHLNKDKLNQQWDPEWIDNNNYDNRGYEFIQTIHLNYKLSFYNPKISTELVVDHQLLDVKSPHREYFFDYSRSMPVYSRDDIFRLQGSFAYKFDSTIEGFVQNFFTLNNFDGDLPQIFSHESQNDKPALYRNDFIFGGNYYQNEDCIYNLWLGIYDQSKGPRFALKNNIALGIGLQYLFHYSEYRNPKGESKQFKN